MARQKNAVPSYLLHQRSGQARVRIAGREFFLGPFGSEESRIKYGELIARHNSGLPVADPLAKNSADCRKDSGPSIAEICLAFWKHAQKHYKKNGKATSEISCFESCIRILRQTYGLTPANEFGPLALKAIRAQMVTGDPNAKDKNGEPCPRKPWARKTVNRMVGRIRHVFKFAIANEMISESVLVRLRTVEPLLKGRDHGAKDYKKRHAVDQANIDAVRSRVRPLVRDLIDLQLATGARSGELLKLTTRMIDRSKETWVASIADHKASHHDQARSIPFGPKARNVLERYLRPESPDEVLLDITRAAYCRSITRACELAKIDRWTPHFLRHTFITLARETCGRDAAQAMAGHSSAATTEEYSWQMIKLASETAAAIG